jgi:hypothetical protein
VEISAVSDIPAENIAQKPTLSIQKIDFTGSENVLVFGDSWSDFKFYPNNFIRMFADSANLNVINTAELGLGSANMVAEAFSKMDTVRNNTNVIALSGFNDIRFTGATTEQLNFQRNAFRALLVNQFIDTWRPAGNADNTGGRFTSFDRSLGPHFKSNYSTGRKAAYTSSVSGVFLEYNFTGTNIGVSFVGQDTTAILPYERPIGRWRVLIDGVEVDIPQIHQQTYGHIPNYQAPQTIFPYIKIYSGLSDGPHVLRLEPIESGNKFVDFIFTLRDPSLVKPVAILKVPYMTQAGYSIDPNFNKANDAAIDQLNAALIEVRNEFITINAGYSKKIKVINTADYFDRKMDYLPDLIHPNALGQINLFTALRKHINY